MGKGWLRPDEVAGVLRVSTRTVYRLVSEGTLEACKIRRSLRISGDSLEALLVRSKVDPEERLAWKG